MRLVFLLALAVVLTAPACSKTTTTSPDGGGPQGGSGGSATGGSGGARADGPGSPAADSGGPAVAPTNCLGIRECVYKCATDTGCAARCASAAPAAARTAYEMAQACSKRECPMQDPDCRCMAECLYPGACMDLVDACTGAVMDQFCEIQCH
jgi:hypothetical protein